MLDVAGSEARDRRDRRPRHSTTCSRDVRVADAPRPCSPTIPTGRSRSSSPRARPACPKGALYCNRQLAFITQTDVGDTWDGGGRSFTRHVVRAPRLHDEAPGQPPPRRHELHHGRAGAPHDALELLAREHMSDRGGRADAARVDAAPARLRSLRPVVGAVHHRRRRTDHPGPRRRSAPPVRRDDSRRATRAPKPGIGLGTAFDDPDEDAIVSVGRPHASVELAILDEDDAAVDAGEIGEVCLRSPAVMSGYWHDEPSRPRPRSPPTGSSAPAISAGSTTAAACASSAAQGDVRPRRLQRVSGRGRSACSRSIPTSPRSRSCRAPTT